jgi:hypothetical protein
MKDSEIFVLQNFKHKIYLKIVKKQLQNKGRVQLSAVVQPLY